MAALGSRPSAWPTRAGGAVLAAAMAATVLGACGAGEADPPTPVAATSVIDEWGPSAELPAGWSMEAATVERILAVDDGAIEVDATFEPLRLADRGCAGDLGGWIEDPSHPDVIWLSVVVARPNVHADESLLEPRRDHGPCPEAPTTLTLDLEQPLGGDDIQVGTDALWVSTDDGTYTLCELPGCDPASGDRAARATCDDGGSLVSDVRAFGDVGMHAGIGERRCEDGWAMVEADIGAGACGPTDGGPNPCAGERIDRLFLRAGTPHWEVITRTREAGCGSVAEVEPDFPPSLCEDLPALAGP